MLVLVRKKVVRVEVVCSWNGCGGGLVVETLGVL